MARYLIRFGYDGLGFAGWARQPGLRTVEGTVRDGLVRIGLLPATAAPGLEVASRTDAGVSARGNALTLVSSLDPGPLLRVLNGIAPEVFFTHAQEVPEEFRARQAHGRWYRYYLAGSVQRYRSWNARLGLFEGPVDVRTFGRGTSGPAPVLRPVRSVTLGGDTSGAWLDIQAPSFVWGMVRKIVAALEGWEAGRLTGQEVEQAIRGERRLTVPLASPGPLILWDVEYGLPWTTRARGLNRRQSQYLETSRRASELRSRMLPELATLLRG